jgi:iron complex outermembrane receptor protein
MRLSDFQKKQLFFQLSWHKESFFRATSMYPSNPISHAVSGWFIVCPRLIRQTLTALLLSLPMLAHPSDSVTNQAPADLTALSLESLMQIEVPKVYAASKIEQKVTQAPASITIITADEVKKFGYQTLGDVLKSVQGFNVSYDRNYDFVGVRGVSLGDYNNRILLLVDGHRVNNNLTDGAFVDTAFLLDLDLVDRVEVIRGPSAVLYGNNAFFGVINVITRTGAQLNGFEVSGGYGSFDTYKARVSYGKRFNNGLEFLLSGTYFDRAGNSKLFYNEFGWLGQDINNGIAQNMDGDKSGSLFGSLAYGDFSFEGAFNRREKVNPTAQYNLTTFNDPRLRTTDEQGYAALKYAHSFKDDFDVTVRLYYDYYQHEIGYPQSLVANGQLLYSAFSTEQDTGEWWGTEVQLNKRLWDRHVFTLGAEYRDDFQQDSQLVNAADPKQSSFTSASRQSYGVYGQGDVALLHNLHLNAGLRYDQYGHFDPAFDPRVALIYNPFEGSAFKAIYGTAFRAPNFTELSDPRFQDIQPEEITSYELVYDQELGPHLRSSFSGFYNQMDHLIVFNSGNYTNFNAKTKGAELALEGSWTNGIRCRASYSLQATADDTVTWQMPDSPTHLIKLNVSVPVIPDKLFAGLEFQYTSDRHALDTISGLGGTPITVQGVQAGGFAVVNFTLFSHNLLKNLDISASVYNLLDRHYADPATLYHLQETIPQDGRSFRLNVTYRF